MENSPLFNPYDILGVSQAVSKAEITKAVAVAMKQKQHNIKAIAAAQKSLMNPRKRIIADYLRPVLPTIKRFKREDLSALSTPAPTLILLPEFDDLDGMIARAIAEDNLENSQVLPQELLQMGIDYCKQERYLEAIQSLENFAQTCLDYQATEYLNSQMWLVKSYQSYGNLEKAIATCERLINNQNSQVQIWADKTLSSLISTQIIQQNKTEQTLPIAIENFKNGNYSETIKLLEEFCQHTINDSKNYLEAQMWLVKAYQSHGELPKAIALCEELVNNQHNQVQIWAKKTISLLYAEVQIQQTALSTVSNPLEKTTVVNQLSIALDNLNQGKYLIAMKLLEEFCQTCGNRQAKEYLQAQMSLVKAYHSAGKLEKAFTLCQQLVNNDNMQVQTWAKQVLNSLFAAK